MAPEQGPDDWLYFLVYLSWGYKRRNYASKYSTGENQPSANNLIWGLHLTVLSMQSFAVTYQTANFKRAS